MRAAAALPRGRRALLAARGVSACAGDALIFNYLTIHGSDLNRSERPRRLWLVQVRDPQDNAVAHVIEGQAQQIAGEGRPGQGTMLCGINPRINFEIKRGG